MLFRTCAHVGGNGGKSAKERAEAREVTLITQGKRGYINGARVYKGVGQVIKHEIAGTLAALSLTPMHSLRHRLVRSRQYAYSVALGFLRF